MLSRIVGVGLQTTADDPFFFQAEDGIRDYKVTGVQTCALPICRGPGEQVGRQVLALRDQGPDAARGLHGGGGHLLALEAGELARDAPVLAADDGERRAVVVLVDGLHRSEERRVGKEWRSRWAPYH